MSEAFKQAIGLLPKLSATELKELSARIKALGQWSSSAPAGTLPVNGSITKELIASIICSTLEAKGVEFTKPYQLLRGLEDRSTFHEKLEGLQTYLDRASPERVVQLGILNIGVDLLYNHLLEWGLPITSHTLLNHINRVPAVLNASFPGYARTGILAKIVRTPKEERNHVRHK